MLPLENVTLMYSSYLENVFTHNTYFHTGLFYSTV